MNNRKGFLLIFTAVLFWSVVGLFTKHIGWNGFSIGTIRGVIAFVFMFLFIRKIPRKLNKVKIITALCYFAQGLLFVAANKYTSAANATVLQNTSPIYIIILSAVISKQKPKRRDIITTLVLLSGVVISFAGSFGDGGLFGNILALCSAVFYSGVYFTSKLNGADAEESTLLGNLFYFALIPICLMDDAFMASTPTDWLYAVLLGATLSVAWICFSRGIKYVDSLNASFIALLEPVLAPVWTLIFLQEKPGIWSIVGDVIVIATLVVYQFLSKKEK